MLKSSIPIFLFVVLLLAEGSVPPLIAHFLAFVGGLCLVTIPDLIKKKLAVADFIVRLIKIIGLVIIGGLLWPDKSVKNGFLIYIMLCTLFTDLIVSIVYEKGKAWVMNKSKNINNE